MGEGPAQLDHNEESYHHPNASDDQCVRDSGRFETGEALRTNDDGKPTTMGSNLKNSLSFIAYGRIIRLFLVVTSPSSRPKRMPFLSITSLQEPDLGEKEPWQLKDGVPKS